MEALKNWLLLVALVAVAFLGLEVRSQSSTIERLAAAQPREKEEGVSVAAPAPAPPLPAVQTSVPEPPAEPPGDTEPAADRQSLADELERYKTGLDRCVVALNATLVASQRREAHTFVVPEAPAPAPVRAAAADIVELSEPWVLPSGNHVTVSGKLYNRGDADGIVMVSVTLLDRGRQFDAKRQRVSVGAGQTVSWQQAFLWNGRESMWSARVELEPL